MSTNNNEHILEFLKSAVKTNKLAHGYLFLGPEKETMKETALWLADLLNTSDFDITYIVPGKNKKNIVIKQIRKVRKDLNLSPYNSQYKFAIINQAETMNKDAANALLKTLEEPKRDTVLILITSKPDYLPETIVSRLQKIQFKSISLEKTLEKLVNQEYIEVLKNPLNDILKFIEEIHRDKSATMEMLNSWLFWFRKKMYDDNNYARTVREIQKTKEMILSTNINKRLALENLVLQIK